MYHKILTGLSLILILATTSLFSQSPDKDDVLKIPVNQGQTEKNEVDVADSMISKENGEKGIHVIAYYFHSTRRCVTCKKLEAYSKEAIESGFKDELEKGTLVIKAVNTDEKENKHYIDDYKLYTKALILSRVKDNQELEWKNLDQIWKLVGNEDKYKAYVVNEIKEFLGED